MNKKFKIFLESLKIAEELDATNNANGNKTTIWSNEEVFYINTWQNYDFLDKTVVFGFAYKFNSNELSFGISSIVSSEESKKVMSAFKKFLSRKSQGKITIDIISQEGISYKLLLRGNIDFLKSFVAGRVDYVEEFFSKGASN